MTTIVPQSQWLKFTVPLPSSWYLSQCFLAELPDFRHIIC